jgi:hypothetical protein
VGTSENHDRVRQGWMVRVRRVVGAMGEGVLGVKEQDGQDQGVVAVRQESGRVRGGRWRVREEGSDGIVSTAVN